MYLFGIGRAGGYNFLPHLLVLHLASFREYPREGSNRVGKYLRNLHANGIYRRGIIKILVVILE